MEKRLNKYDLLNKSVKIEAIDGNTLQSDNIVKNKEKATTMSHIKTIKQAYEDGEEMVIIMEDDCCWEEIISKWKRPIFEWIHSIKKEWMTIQLGCQGPHDQEISTINNENTLLIPWKLRHYGAFCYVINRKGMKYSLDKYHENKLNEVADFFVFDNPASFTSTIPWFFYEGLDSNIHPDYLPHHNKHIQFVKKLYDENNIQWFDKDEDLKKFVFIIPSYNNSGEVIDCLTSTINQNYPKTHYRIVYGDDYSDDGSVSVVKNFLKSQTKEVRSLFTFQFNKQRKFACWMRNYLIQKFTEEDEICVLLDGDDRVADPYVLSYINKMYRNPDIWITYGGYSSSDGKRKDWGDWPQKYKQKEGGLRESGTWYGSSIRTFYSKLYKKINMDDLLDENYDWFEAATEVAIMIPMLEMAGEKHSYYVKDGRVLYLYTIHPNQQYSPERVKLQRKNADFIFRKKIPYSQIESL